MDNRDYAHEEKSGCVEHQKRTDKKICKAKKHLETGQAVYPQDDLDKTGQIFYRLVCSASLRTFFGVR